MPEQRRLDRVLDPAYLEGLGELPLDEVKAKKAECVELETEVSFVRRLAQGRIDILDAERERRASGGSMEDLIARLSQILADDGPRPTPSQGHLPQAFAPSPTIEWSRGLESLVGDSTLLRLPDLSDEELEDIRSQLADLEREVSVARRSLHDILHVVERELVERIQAARQ
jgi:hypothetical protein